ncbi:MAG: dTMP kinase [Ginsengibacter sp.]
MKDPIFIVIEGVDGSGKSTQIELLKHKFMESGLKIMDTHEPSNGPIGMLIRNIMIGRIQTDQSTIASLFLADRLDHINNPINGMKKRLSEGYNIISSRYYFSSYAFQSEYVPIEWIVNCNSLCKEYLKPDIIFYLNVDPVTCSTRLAKNRIGAEIYENLEKIIKANNEFLNAFEKYGKDENIFIIDGNQSIDAIQKNMWDNIASFKK